MQVIAQLGAPDGIFVTAQRNRTPLGYGPGQSGSPFARLEEHLSAYQRFFLRYTTEDFLQVRK